jgi:hypothetical protein
MKRIAIVASERAVAPAGCASSPAAVALVLAACAVVLAACAAPASGQNRAQALTDRIAKTELRLRTEKDPDLRKRLAEDIESTKHELGPKDANGNPVKPQAMWHSAALDQLDAELKRLALRGKPSTGAALAAEGRGTARRMASLCLARGWGWGGTLPKYQFDAFGSYLANGMPAADALMDSAAAHLAREGAAMAEGPDRDAFQAGIAQIKEGLALMAAGTDAFKDLDWRTDKGQKAGWSALAGFVDGLRKVQAADASLKEMAGRLKAGDAGAAAVAAPSAEAPPDAPAELTHEEAAAVERTRKNLESIAAPEWETVKTELLKYLAVAEQGLKVPSARSGAAQLLDALDRGAAAISGALESRSAYPELLAEALTGMTDVLTYLRSPSYRSYAYGRLRRMSIAGSDRKALDSSPLSTDACRALLRLKRMPYATFKTLMREEQDPSTAHERLQLNLETTVRVLGKMAAWPPKDLTPQLAPLADRCRAVFLESADALAKTPQDNGDAVCVVASGVGAFAGDVERLLGADAAIKAVAQYVPTRAAPMYADLVRDMGKIVGETTEAAKVERRRLDDLFRPFGELAGLRLPDAEHTKVVTAIVGPIYKNAVQVLSRDLTLGLTAASKGDSTNLDYALDARVMFSVLRHRAVAQTKGLPKAGTAMLEAFSTPDKPWTAFTAALDQHVRRLMTNYGNQRGRDYQGFSTLRTWDSVYATLCAAQCQTLQERPSSEPDIDALIRHLALAADPNVAEATWYPWAIGYHTTEAAVCLASGYERTAGLHLYELRQLRDNLYQTDVLSAAVFDPK